jgi:photosystem II stability/assembly factor-like uncharacterized protein
MGGRFALVIGNCDYDDATLSRLESPAIDVESLITVFRNPDIGAFDVAESLVSPDRIQAERAIARLFANRRQNDLVLLYFSGHGIRDEDGHLYFAVKDTDRNLLVGTSIASSFVKLVMDKSYSRRQILILDCCHSGAFSPGFKGAKGDSPDSVQQSVGSPVGTREAFSSDGYGRVILTASDATQYAWEAEKIEGASEGSVFTRYLATGLSTGEADIDRDGKITVDDLYAYTYERVIADSQRQRPQKFGAKEEGRLVIAKAPVRMVALPMDLERNILSDSTRFRAAAAQELNALLSASNHGLRLAAFSALIALTEDDSNAVRMIAEVALRCTAESLNTTDDLFSQATSCGRARAEERRRIADREREQQEAAEKAERERQKQDAAEKAERERQNRVATEKAERKRQMQEAAEKAERERQMQEAAEKAERERQKQEAAEKADRERQKQEAAEKADREREQQEAAEKAERERQMQEAAEKAERERQKQEAAEKADRERQKQEAAEKADREREQQEAAEKAERERQKQEAAVQVAPLRPAKLRKWGIIGGALSVITVIAVMLNISPKSEIGHQTNIVTPSSSRLAQPASEIAHQTNTVAPTSSPLEQSASEPIAGSSWLRRDSPVKGDFSGVFGTADGRRIWTVTAELKGKKRVPSTFPAFGQKFVEVPDYDGVIIGSDDYGKSWKALSRVDTANGIFGTSDGSHLWTLGPGRTVLRSDDGAKTWTSHVVNVKENLNGIGGTSDGKHLWIFGWDGEILSSEDGGDTWTRHPSGTLRALRSVFVTPDGGHITFVGDEGTILGSDDSGVTWNARKKPPGTSSDYWSIIGTADGKRLWAGAEFHDGIGSSSDGGITWKEAATGAGEIKSMFGAQDCKRIWAVGDGSIIRSDDGGQRWAKVTTEKNGPTGVYSISGTPDAKHLWAVAYRGTIFTSAAAAQ